ncbi:MAG: hypothetical protein M3N19_12625 [Candidatus Eremiobacteraeota bacterium]|nr:hypothetical protein [Candidatus Eremiobacteraeota bacterium]
MIFLGFFVGLGGVLLTLFFVTSAFPHNDRAVGMATVILWCCVAGLGIYLLTPPGRAVRAGPRAMVFTAIVIYLGALAVCTGIFFSSHVTH